MRRALSGRNFNIAGLAGGVTAALSAVALAFLGGPWDGPVLAVFTLSLSAALCVGLVRSGEWYVGFLSERGVGSIRLSWLVQVLTLIAMGLVVDYFFDGVVALIGAAAWAVSITLLALRLLWAGCRLQVRSAEREPPVPSAYRIAVLLVATAVCGLAVALHHWHPLPGDAQRYVIAMSGLLAVLSSLTLLPELTAWRGYGLMLEWRVSTWRLRRSRRRAQSRRERAGGSL